MNKKECLERYNIQPICFQKQKNIDVITTLEKKYVLKETNNTNIYDYLKTRNFYNFPTVLTNLEDRYEITEYLEDFSVPEEQRIEDLIYLVSILHTKTTFYKNVDTDFIKKIYEETKEKQDYLYNYYLSIQDMIEKEVFMSPSNYLLIRNISTIYQNIRLSREYLTNWYEKVKDTKKIRYVLTHGNLSKNHLIENKDSYLISWDNARVNLPIYDLIDLYQKNYDKIDIEDLLSIYQSKYVLKEDEKDLLFSLILLPEKVDMTKQEFQKLKMILSITEKSFNLQEKISKMKEPIN
ncbi:MAG: hypothetical protein E7168_04775 [Firmicutes bacterium]|nr:hypothetical protein [Bacillota bacterium]